MLKGKYQERKNSINARFQVMNMLELYIHGSVFGSTCICEKMSSEIKYIKSNQF